MAVTTESVSIYRGETVTVNFAKAPSGSIAGWTIRFTVAKKVDSSSKLIGPVAPVIDNALTGTLHVDLQEEQTDIKAGSYIYDLWRTDEGFEELLAIGPFIISGDARVPPTESV